MIFVQPTVHSGIMFDKSIGMDFAAAGCISSPLFARQTGGTCLNATGGQGLAHQAGDVRRDEELQIA